ncbi:unnamed protein product [Tuber aestivum]|uniref:Uncharacterized protein n=1 Tax=Tuber aestivum TaxID=59557 RepID=A0A292Q882_9PEZI|nr:unnamed protein product [Tuber aestivum]
MTPYLNNLEEKRLSPFPQTFSLGSRSTVAVMEDLPVNSSPLSPAEQARIRRERRQAKVKEGGSSRLNRITGTQGQTFRNQETSVARPAQESTPDPPDVDISVHHYEPKARQQERIGREDISAGMGPPPSFRSSPLADTRGLQDPLFGAGGDLSDLDLGRLMMENNMFGSQVGGAGSGREDPMLQMMQQLMGGAGGLDGVGGPGGLGGPGMGMGTPPPEIQQMQQREQSWGMRWKALHVLGSLCLAVWVLRGTDWSFTGSALERAESANMTREEAPPMFWYFATMELILQSSRFFLEKVERDSFYLGRPPPGSWLTTIGGFLPYPFGTFLTTIARYSVIWTTLIADAGVLIFCLGMVSWWNS